MYRGYVNFSIYRALSCGRRTIVQLSIIFACAKPERYCLCNRIPTITLDYNSLKMIMIFRSKCKLEFLALTIAMSPTC